MVSLIPSTASWSWLQGKLRLRHQVVMCPKLGPNPSVVGTDLQARVASFDPHYEAITQQIAYLMSAIINQNSSKNNECNGSKESNGNDKFPTTKFQRPKRDRKDMKCWGYRGTRHSWRECLRIQGKVITSLSTQLIKITIKILVRIQMANGGRKHATLQSSPSNDQGGIKIEGQLSQAGLSNGPEYYNPDPWVRILGTANETENEIDGKISKALIDNGAIISMMSKGYCDEHGYEIQPLDQLVPIEGG